MKKKCNKDNAVKYAFQLMDELEEKKYKLHIENCPECKLFLKSMLDFKKINKYREKIFDRVPAFEQIQFPEKNKEFHPWRNAILKMPYRKVLRYAAAVPVVFIIIFGIMLLNKKDIKKDTEVTLIEKSTQSPEQVILKAATSIKKPLPVKEEEWCFNTGGPLRSHPVLQNGVLYFGSDDKTVYAINSETGKLLWEFKTEGLISSSPILKENYVYVASTDGYLYKLHSGTGKSIWKSEIGPLVLSQIFIIHSEIYIANNNGEIMSLNLDARQIWKKKLEINIYSPVNGDRSAIYICSGEGDVYSLSRTNSDLLWSYRTGSHFLSSRPLIINDQLIVGDTDGVLYSLNKSSGRLNWKYSSGYKITTDPACIDEKIYFVSDKLYCLDLLGKELWKYATATPVDINFTVCNNIITLIDKNNNIYSINVEDGYCLKKVSAEDSILSFLCARDRLYVGNQKGEICILK